MSRFNSNQLICVALVIAGCTRAPDNSETKASTAPEVPPAAAQTATQTTAPPAKPAAVVETSLSAAAGSYTIDPTHSVALFRIRHLGVSNYHGRFNKVTGTIDIDGKNPERSTIHLEIETASVFTASKKRDDHLRGTDFLNAKEFPKIVFDGGNVKPLGERKYEVQGKLSVHGVTKELTIAFEHVGAGKDPWGNFRTGFEAVFTIQRTDFGMDKMVGSLSDQVGLTIAIEAMR